MDEPNILNIPAYQRKRSIAARARKKPSYTLAKTSTKKAKKPRKYSAGRIIRITDQFEAPGFLPETPEPISNVLPSQELFPHNIISSRKTSELREMKRCGICEGYFDKIDVAIIKVTSAIRKDDIIIFEKQDGLFEQKVTSMQINRKDVSLATTGSEIGIKVPMKPQVGGSVYKVI